MSGKNPLGNSREPQSYEGLNVIVPVGGWQLIKAQRAPTTSDKKYPVGSIWVYTTNNTAYILTSAPGNWQTLESNSGGVLQVSQGGTGVPTLAAHGVVVGEGTSAVAVVGPGAVGTVLQGQGGSSDPVFTAISELTIVNQNTSSATLAVSNTYITNNGASLVTYTLPATATQGSIIKIVGSSAGGWKIAQNASQQIKSSGGNTTSGVNGSLSSSNANDCVELIASVGGASTIWTIANSSGTLTFV